MKHILGIDTTFHTSGVGLVDECGKVLTNEKINIDFTDENAERFFTLHTQNTLSLVKPLLNRYSKDIFLISVANQKGPFHSTPVGAIIGNTLSQFFDKEIIGVDHEVSHIYSNWLERNRTDFRFPIISLSVSGAHTNIWLLKNHRDIRLARKILFSENEADFGGLGALLGWVCYFGLRIGIKKGEGGAHIEQLAHDGEPKYYRYLNFDIKKEGEEYKFLNVRDYLSNKIKEFGYFRFSDKERERFQKDFACSLLQVLFDSLSEIIKELAMNFQPKEIHLTGGAAVNKIMINKLKRFCENENLDFKTPLNREFCGDNGAMTAMAGYYKWKFLTAEDKKKNEFLPIKPSIWYYKYYVDKFLK